MKRLVLIIFICIFAFSSCFGKNNNQTYNENKDIKYKILKGRVHSQNIKEKFSKADDEEDNGPYVKTVVYDDSSVSLDDHLKNIVDFIKSLSDYDLMRYEVLGKQGEIEVEYLSFTFRKDQMKKAVEQNVNIKDVYNYAQYFFINPPLSGYNDVRVAKEYGSTRVIKTKFNW